MMSVPRRNGEKWSDKGNRNTWFVYLGNFETSMVLQILVECRIYFSWLAMLHKQLRRLLASLATDEIGKCVTRNYDDVSEKR